MEFNAKKLRIPFALIIGILFGCFGVFIFGDFQYRGLTLEENIFPLFTLDSWTDGLYQLLGSGFMVDWFNEFSLANLESNSVWSILTGETVWPCILTWSIGGFASGVIAKGVKRSIYVSLSYFALIFILWTVFGFFAGADMAVIFINNILILMSEIFTAILFLMVGSLIGGRLSGPYEN